MHGAVGTALGGVCTLVGEPQNLLIAERAGWNFMEFFWRMAPITMPVLVAGLITCVLLEKVKWFSYGANLPESVYMWMAPLPVLIAWFWPSTRYLRRMLAASSRPESKRSSGDFAIARRITATSSPHS